MARKNRPNYVQEIVDKANERLRYFKIKDESNDLFVFVCDYLLKKDMYRGYNFFNTKNYQGKDYVVLAGSATNYEYLQIY